MRKVSECMIFVLFICLDESKYVNEIVPAKNHTYDRGYGFSGMREIVDEHNLSKIAKQYTRRLKTIPWDTIWGGMVLGGYDQFLTWTHS